jgi:hypothetical protein
VDTTKEIKKAAEANLGQKYGPGNQCDDFVESVLNQAGVNPSGYLAGPASGKTVQDHIDDATTKGTTTTTPSVGANTVFMNNSPKGYSPHAGIIIVDDDGKVSLYHSSSGNPGGLSREEGYDDVDSFEKVHAYNDFHYQEIK